MGDFFRINMPYGMCKNEKGQWYAFNRAYQPIGWNKHEIETKHQEYPIHTCYKGLTGEFIKSIAETTSVGDGGEIVKFWLYGDRTNPLNTKNKKDFDRYFDKLKKLSKLMEIQ